MIDDNVSAQGSDTPRSRRAFLGWAGAAAAATVSWAQGDPIPIIDTHFHLYHSTRPQGAPFPETPNPPPFLRRNFLETALPLGIVGGIEVEASPWVEDNLWVLAVIENVPMIVGTVGDLDPLKTEFCEYLERDSLWQCLGWP